MNTEQQAITTIEESMFAKKNGIDFNTADFSYDIHFILNNRKPIMEKGDIPCWSIFRMLTMLVSAGKEYQFKSTNILDIRDTIFKDFIECFKQ